MKALAARLPDWQVTVPGGGLSLWCELPEALSTAVTVAAEAEGLVLASGPQFAVEGGLERWLRLPFTHAPEVLADAVDRLARAWESADAPAVRTPAVRHAPPHAAGGLTWPAGARLGTIENFPWSDATRVPLLQDSGWGGPHPTSGRGRGGRSGRARRAAVDD